jgi:uncharacterized protein (TIGR00251 family)
MSTLKITDHPEGARLEIRVKPRSSRTAVIGILDGTLVLSLTAPPVDGQANESLTKFLAKWTHRPPRTVTLVNGAKSKNKLINFSGLSAEQLEEVLSPLCLQLKDR